MEGINKLVFLMFLPAFEVFVYFRFDFMLLYVVAMLGWDDEINVLLILVGL